MASTPVTDPSRLVAFQGVPGAYSHLACRQALPDLIPLPRATFEDAFAAVTDGTADRALIPIENSLNGRVADIHHLLPESGLFIIDEHFLRVRHHLLAPKGARIDKLKRVYSHIQGLGQCRKMIRDLGLEAHEVADTAGAAKEIAERGNLEEAAIASELAGEIYGLESLRANVEDRLGNTTRFILMARHRADPDPKAGPTITSFIFQVKSQPAALYKALGGFATNGVNVIKLESYMVDSSFTVAQFYAEVEGHPADKATDRALDELKYFSSRFKMLGVFPVNPYRRQT